LGEEVTWGIDLADGGAALVIAVLLNHGQNVLYISGRAINRASEGYRGEGKTDAKDAAVIADQARIRRDLRPLRRPRNNVTAPLHDIAAGKVPQLVGVPACPVKEMLLAPGGVLAGVLGQLPPVLPREGGEQTRIQSAARRRSSRRGKTWPTSRSRSSSRSDHSSARSRSDTTNGTSNNPACIQDSYPGLKTIELPQTR
jgi:transposase